MNPLAFQFLMPAARADHKGQEAEIKASASVWTIVRPSGLTDAAAPGNYEVGEHVRAKASRIPQVALAILMAKCLADDGLIRSSIRLTH